MRTFPKGPSRNYCTLFTCVRYVAHAIPVTEKTFNVILFLLWKVLLYSVRTWSENKLISLETTWFQITWETFTNMGDVQNEARMHITKLETIYVPTKLIIAYHFLKTLWTEKYVLYAHTTCESIFQNIAREHRLFASIFLSYQIL